MKSYREQRQFGHSHLKITPSVFVIFSKKAFRQLGQRTCLSSGSSRAISTLSSRGFENSLAKSVRVTQPRNFSPSKTPSLVIRFSTIVFVAVFVDSSGPILKNGTIISLTLTSSGLLFSGTNFQSSARSVIKPTTFLPQQLLRRKFSRDSLHWQLRELCRRISLWERWLTLLS